MKLKRDNAGMTDVQDTGVKITVFFVINMDDKPDKEYGTITIKDASNIQNETTLNLRSNSIVLLKSRKALYSIQANS